LKSHKENKAIPELEGDTWRMQTKTEQLFGCEDAEGNKSHHYGRSKQDTRRIRDNHNSILLPDINIGQPLLCVTHNINIK